MTTPTPHGQVSEALIDLIDTYAETRHRYGRIHNARTEAARNAVIEALSGVQALSAAPVAFLKSVIALCSHRGYSPANIEAWDKDDKWIADLWRQAESMLAASPTPPADQQAAQVIINFPQVGTAGPFPVVDGRVSLPDSTMQDLVRMLRPTYEAEQQARPDECFPGEPKVAVPQGLISAACFAIRNKRDGGKVLEQLRRYSVGNRSQPLAPQQTAPKTTPGEPSAHQILAITTAYEQGVGKGHQAYKSGKEIANPYDSAYGCDLAWQYGYKEGKEQAQREAKAAPQQEAQEPVAWLNPWRADQVTTDYDAYGEHGIPLYTAPQPSPAPLSDDVKDAARYRWLREGNDTKHGAAWHVAVNLYGCEWDAAIDAALAAQGGKDAG